MFPTFFVNQNDKIPLDGFLVTKIPISVKFSTFIFSRMILSGLGSVAAPSPVNAGQGGDHRLLINEAYLATVQLPGRGLIGWKAAQKNSYGADI